MRSNLARKPRSVTANITSKVAAALETKLIGQPEAIEAIVPYIQMYEAGLCASGRPGGVFMLLGPTGTGKTHTVEALAEVLHGSSTKVLRIDCAEFQMEHEVAKLIGAPPGYLGHRETQPLLTQQKLNGITSDSHDIAILLFDEIEKAAPSMTRLLLGILDKATLRLGDNTAVNFEKTIIFLTSNLGAKAMAKESGDAPFGFSGMVPSSSGQAKARKLAKIGEAAMRRKFTPEFINRIDATITYRSLTKDAITSILDRQLVELQRTIDGRLGVRAFHLDVPPRTRKWLAAKGVSEQYGARELKRTIHRSLMQPLASFITSNYINPDNIVRADVSGDQIVLKIVPPEPPNV